MKETTDPFAQFKQVQREGWAYFAPLETFTTPPAGELVTLAGIKAGQKVLDVACGTGVVAVTAARRGAQVTALDLTPELLVRARENAELAGVTIDFREGDVEQLPFDTGAFDVVLSQYGHMFAPRPAVAIAEMLRVLAPGGTIAFSTWPPEMYIGRIFTLVSSYLPPPPPGVSPPVQWGEPSIVRERLGDAVSDLIFRRSQLLSPTLSPQHTRSMMEKTAGPVVKLVQALSASDPAKLAQFRRDLEALIAEFATDNVVAQDFLMTRAIKS
jgi:ubiquinone/menaquinone biosynthesis C-methylase UbiE